MKNLLILIAIFISLSTVAQKKKEVTPILEEYFSKMKNREWASSLDYTYPKLFDLAPRDQVEAQMVNTLNDTSVVKVSFLSFDIANIGKVIKDDLYDYSFIDYSMVMTMDFYTDSIAETTSGILLTQYGQENVTIDGAIISIVSNNTIAAIKEKDQEKIYFLEIKDELIPLLESFMSASFIENAKNK